MNDAHGQVLQRYQRMEGWDPGERQALELHYYFNGIAIGDVGNNGTSKVDYAASIALHTRVPPGSAGPFADGSNTHTPYADFDQAYDPINGLTYESTFSRYTVMAGDTLETVAIRLWGDASYWYLIAEANGLFSGETLVEGRSLIIPNKVHNAHNTSEIYRVYDPNEAIGDTSPSRAKPPKRPDQACGVMGQVLLVVIAVVVAYYTAGALAGPMTALAASMSLGTTTAASTAAVAAGTTFATVAGTGVAVGSTAAVAGSVAAGAIAGAAGSIVSQGVGVATGIQSRFNWGAVGIAAIAGGVGAGLGPAGINAFGTTTGSSFINGALRGIAGNVLTQGIGLATGLQRRFDWAGVAAAGMAGAIAGAAARTAVGGGSFGDNIMAVLPDAIGTTIGNAIAHEIGGPTGGTEQQPVAGEGGGQTGRTSLFPKRMGVFANYNSQYYSGGAFPLDAPLPFDDGPSAVSLADPSIAPAATMAWPAGNAAPQIDETVTVWGTYNPFAGTGGMQFSAAAQIGLIGQIHYYTSQILRGTPSQTQMLGAYFGGIWKGAVNTYHSIKYVIDHPAEVAAAAAPEVVLWATLPALVNFARVGVNTSAQGWRDGQRMAEEYRAASARGEGDLYLAEKAGEITFEVGTAVVPGLAGAKIARLIGALAKTARIPAAAEGIAASIDSAASEFNVADRVAQLNSAIPADSRGFMTMGVGLAEDASGVRHILIGTSEPGGYLRRGVTLQPAEILAGGLGHAEEDIVNFAIRNELRLLEIGATRPICPNCAAFIEFVGAKPVTPLKGQ